MLRPPRFLALFLAMGLSSSAACASRAAPDTADVLARYEQALARGDAESLHSLLSVRSRSELPPSELRRYMSEAQEELQQQARQLRGPDARTRVEASLLLGKGDDVRFVLEQGTFRLRGGARLHLPALTPIEALAQLRTVLAGRSYAALALLLTPTTRAAVEADLRSLVEGLSEPEGLHVQLHGETAQVELPGGHVVFLRSQAGVWQVEDFE